MLAAAPFAAYLPVMLHQRRPLISATFISLVAIFAGWSALTSSNWMWGLETAVLAVAAGGLWTNQAWSRWAVWAVAALSVVPLAGYTAYLALTNWPYADALHTFAGLLPGAAWIAAWVGVSIAVARHFRPASR